MSANPLKFQVMLLGIKRKNYLCFNINEQQIPPSYHVELLGVTMDNALKIDTHEHGKCKNVNQNIYIHFLD